MPPEKNPEKINREHLSIEVGVSCNNSCVFCYQKGYRQIKGFKKMIPTEELKRKLEIGRGKGIEEAGFTGGEPTIHKDFIDILKYSQSLGYKKISVTTNGKLFNDFDFALRAVQSGLNSIGISIHGHNEIIHDSLTDKKGSFKKTLGGIKNMVWISQNITPLELNCFTLVNKMNYRNLCKICDLLFNMGIKLFVFQPIIYSKANIHNARSLSIPFQSFIDAVRKAIRNGIERGYKVKVYNIPLCFFSDLMDGLDQIQYHIQTFRGENIINKSTGFFRMKSCFKCVDAGSCPGIPASFLDIKDILHNIEKTLSIQLIENEIWVGGLEMLDENGIKECIKILKKNNFNKIVFTYGGVGFLGERFINIAMDGGCDEVCLITYPRGESKEDIIISYEGNLKFVYQTILGGKNFSGGGKISILFPLNNKWFGKEDKNIFRNIFQNVQIIRLILEEIEVEEINSFIDYIKGLEIKKIPSIVIMIEDDVLKKSFFQILKISQSSKIPLKFELIKDNFLKHPMTEKSFSFLNWSNPQWLKWDENMNDEIVSIIWNSEPF